MTRNRPQLHNLESEKIVLGTLLSEEKLFEKVLNKLRNEDFYRDSHRQLFDILKEMRSKKINIDVTSVWDYIKSKNIKGEISEFIYLDHLRESVATFYTLDYHIQKVLDCSKIRTIRLSARNFLKCYNESPSDVAKLFDDFKYNIANIDFSNIENVELISATDLVDQCNQEPEFFIQDLIPKGTLIAITAPPGLYKTWIAMLMSACSSEGSNFLNYKSIKSKVVYINKENPSSLLSMRLKLIRKINNSLKFWNYDSKMPPPNIIEIAPYKSLTDGNTLLVFDSLIRFHDADENSSSEMSRVFNKLKELTTKGDSVLILHHKGKSEGSEYRGSSEIKAGVDIFFILEKKDDLLTLTCTKHRFKIEFKTTFKIVSSEGSFSIEPADDPSYKEKIDRIQDVVDTLTRMNKEEKEPNQTELVDKLHNDDNTVSKKKWREYVIKATQEGKIIGIPTGLNNQIHYRVNKSVFQFSHNIVEKNGKTEKLHQLMPDEPSFS